MKNIWIPHIPKNGGMTIIQSITDYCLANKNDFESKIIELTNGEPDFFTKETLTKEELDWWCKPHAPAPNPKYYKEGLYDKPSFHFRKFTNKNTGSIIKLHHRNPLEKGMEDWLKILIVRDPISRFVSYFNFVKSKIWLQHKKLDTRTFDEFIDYTKNGDIPLIKHIDWLNKRQLEQTGHVTDRLLSKFTVDSVKHVFDYIIDVSNLNKVFPIIEEHFFQTKIEWKNHNTVQQNFAEMNSEQNEYNFTVFKKEDITENQRKKLLELPIIKDELEFYKSIQDFL